MHGDIINGIYYKREKDASKLRLAGGAWTIPMAEIHTKEISTFVYYTETAQYRISRYDAMTKGFEAKFQGEKKLVVPIKFWLQEPLIDQGQEQINRAYTPNT